MDTGQSKHRLLLVDGDLKSLRVLEVSLKKAGFEVVTTTQGSEALGALQATLPDLIISDTDLDGMDGFDLCRQIKANPEWAKIPFLFVSGRKSIEDKIRGLELGVEDYLTKPIYIKEIGIRVRTALQRAERERLESRREGRTKFAGDLSDIGVVDLVQTIDLNRKSGIVHIVNRDSRRGAVFFRDGRVIDAEVGRLSGTEAMYRLFSWSDGQFEVEFKPIRRRDVIDLPSAALLMEGMRRLDEWTRLLETLPALDSVIEVDVGVLAEKLADLPDEMNGLLRLCDGTRSLLAVIDDSDYPDLEALTVVSKLFGQGIIYARELTSQRGEEEPSSELARWLAEGNAEDAGGDEASAARQFLEEVEPADSRNVVAGEQRATTDDALSSGERQGSKTLKTFSLDTASLSLDTRPPGSVAPEATAQPNKVAVAPKLTGNTLKLTAVSSEQESAPTYSVKAPAVSPTQDREVEAASPLEVSAVVEGSWREPAELALGLPRTPPGGVDATPTEPPKPAAPAAGAMVKPDTLRGFPIPEGLADAAQAGPPPKSAVSDGDRPARTTIEFGLRESALAPSASTGTAFAFERPREPAREMDWGAWGQGAENEAAPKGQPGQPEAPGAEEGEKPTELATGRSHEPQALAAESAQGQAPVSDKIARTQQFGQPAPMMVEEMPASSPSTEDRSVTARPTVDKLDSDVVPHERRWPLFAVILVVVVVGGWFALRIGPTGGRSLLASRSGLPAAPAPRASAPSESSAGPGVADRQSFQPGGKLSESQPTVALVAAKKPVAAPPDAQAKPTSAAGREPASQTEVASGASPSRAADGGQARAPTVGSAPTEGSRERCLKAHAGGNGKPSVILAACRPAIEADPEAADIMVIVASAELERGRAVEARSWAKKALDVNPDLADAYVVLGGAEQEAENPAEAKAAYKKYLELAPSGRHARELRAILDSL